MMHTKIHSYSGPNPPNCAAIVLTDTYYIDIYICVRVRPSVCLYTEKHNAAVKFMVTPRWQREGEREGEGASALLTSRLAL